MKTVSVNRFEEGMTPDIRDTTIGAVKTVKHFDILTRPKSLTPFHSQITGDSAPGTHQFSDFLYYNSVIYAVGIDSGTGLLTVHTKSDFTSTTWGQQGNNAAAAGSPVSGVFIEYHGFAYGFNGDGSVWRNDLSGGTAWNDAVTTISTAAVMGSTAATVHSKDDCLYMATKNVIGRNNNGSWNAAALTLPSRYVVTSLCEYGNYLAIGCKSLYAGGKSIVYLWDRDSTLNTISESIDFGHGSLQIIEQIEGQIVGILVRQDVFNSLQTKLVFRVYNGAISTVFKELLASTAVGLQLIYGQKVNANRLYFLAGITIDGVLHNGVWGIGKNSYGRWIVWFDRLPNNDTAIAASSLIGFFMTGDFVYISYNDSGYKLTQTSSISNAYAGSSLIETTINPEMPLVDRTKKKQVMVIGVSYSPIPSGGQVVCKYKVDGGSWTTIFTETATGQVTTEKTVKSVLGREFEFRVESTGGVVISEIKYQYEITQTLI